MKELKLSRPKLLEQITYKSNMYIQVESQNKELWSFELENTKKISKGQRYGLYKLVQDEINQLNLFVHMGFDELMYSIPEQSCFPMRLPQISILYSLNFWLASLVRYDPHSVAYLQDSRFSDID